MGGSISVNAHGITNDDTMCTSVESAKVVDANGNVVNRLYDDLDRLEASLRRCFG